MNINPFIHIFRTNEKMYVYDVNTNVILQINEYMYNYLKDNSIKTRTFIDDNIKKSIIEMKSNGYLSENVINEIEHPVSEILPFYLNNRLNVITLQVTQQCNLRCDYCVYSGSYEGRMHSNKNMTFNIAKKGIDFIINNSIESPNLTIGFYGGEPLLNFDLIKRCVEYVDEKIEGREITFHITTNGTLLNDKIMDFFVEYDFSLLISLDGPKEIHDKNRVFANNNKGTFDSIMKNMNRIFLKYPDYSKKNIMFNAVLDETTNIDCTKSFFKNYKELNKITINTSFITTNYSKNNKEINENFNNKYKYEKFKVFLHKIGRLDKEYTSDLFYKEYFSLKKDINERIMTKNLNKKNHPGGPCIPSIRKLLLDVNGVFYPCERVSELSEPMKIGNIYDGLNLEKLRNLINIGKLNEEMCKKCWCYRFCYLCSAYADSGKFLSKDKKIKECEIVKYNIEQKFKDYCTLIELGHDFNS